MRSWTLNGVTLPNPTNFGVSYIKMEVYHDSINGRTTKDITGRKKEYTLSWERIDQATVATILSLYELRESLPLEVTDGDLMIAETMVHVDIGSRSYSTKGSEFREDVTVILREVGP